MTNGWWVRFGKRTFDMVLVVAILAILWPLLIMVGILVRLKLGSPVLFSQRRLGIGASEFEMFKFRSMSEARDANGDLLPDSARLTKFGELLRSTSLDELPQIINIVKGEMSFIGPRATMPSYKGALLERYARRFEVLPGITSLPGIRGRNALTWDQKFTMDLEYVERFGFTMDMEIFFKTIPVVLSRGGINMAGEVTASSYTKTIDKQKK